MIPAQEGMIAFAQGAATIATGASHSMVFDSSGYDYAVIDLILGTHSTAPTELLTVCKLVEHSSVTAIGSMEAIVPFTGGTEVSSSVGWVIPSGTLTGDGTVIEFQVDLRKRKKMIGLVATHGNLAIVMASIAKLTRSRESADTAAEKSIPSAKLFTNTAATACAKVITG